VGADWGWGPEGRPGPWAAAAAAKVLQEEVDRERLRTTQERVAASPACWREGGGMRRCLSPPPRHPNPSTVLHNAHATRMGMHGVRMARGGAGGMGDLARAETRRLCAENGALRLEAEALREERDARGERGREGGRQ